MTNRYHIWTEGCQMNVADSAKLAAGLERLREHYWPPKAPVPIVAPVRVPRDATVTDIPQERLGRVVR